MLDAWLSLSSMKTVLLPVKDFADAKQRLASLLSARQRAGLARAMLTDVLQAIAAAKRPDHVVVFTASEEVAKLVRPFEFDIVQEVEVRGHSAAVNQMVDELSVRSTHIVSVAGDLPTMIPGELDALFDASSDGVNLVTSRDGTGTNAALFVLPARIQMEYGEGSLKRHLSNSMSAGFQTRVVRLPGMEFDIDTPEDLQMLRKSGAVASNTWKYLSTL
jgi:2-phospho-L-lactate guanylyltransferase